MRNIRAIILVVFCIINKGRSICSSEYGGEPCRFIPALPGKTPSCAKPGLTYCEHPDNYPARLIQYLVEKWLFDHKTLLASESPEDFSAYNLPSHFDHVSNNLHNQHIPLVGYLPNIYVPKNYFAQNQHSYLPPPPPPPPQNYSEFEGYPDRRPAIPFYEEPPRKINYNYNYQEPYNYQPQQSQWNAVQSPPQVTYYRPNDWWKRDVRDSSKNQSLKTKRRKRSLQHTPVPAFVNNTVTKHAKVKRQAGNRGQTLCQSRTQYIMPRAALNNKGNWMYIVNMPEDNRYKQLVKSETCTSQQCNGLCSLPAGYTSRCEQKYVQKRLVALEGSGDQLYTDVFWFPSCCVCTILNN